MSNLKAETQIPCENILHHAFLLPFPFCEVVLKSPNFKQLHTSPPLNVPWFHDASKVQRHFCSYQLKSHPCTVHHDSSQFHPTQSICGIPKLHHPNPLKNPLKWNPERHLTGRSEPAIQNTRGHLSVLAVAGWLQLECCHDPTTAWVCCVLFQVFDMVGISHQHATTICNTGHNFPVL